MFVALVTFALATPPAEPPKKLTEAAEKELKSLQGKWRVEKMATAGKELFPDKDSDFVVEIKGRTWIFAGQEKAEIIEIDPTTNPKCLDTKSVEEGRRGVVDENVYELDGDTLKVCFYQGKGKNRPTSFDVPKEKDTILVVMKRIKEKP